MRIGSLCSGYGGLEMGVQAVMGGSTAWVSDIDKGACKILAHRFPDAPNLGDFTQADWSTVEPVDILCAGFPCQPVSHAGKRLGDKDERWLWDDVLRAVREVRPGVVVLENVRGLLTARDGELFGRVLGSLAGIGYDASWHGIKAADVGAPHNRFRVFIVATDANRERCSRLGRVQPVGRDTHGRDCADRLGASTEPTSLLPSPRTSDGDPAKTADRMAERGQPLSEVVVNAMDERWGKYANAVRRWERLTSPAPEPTMIGLRGGRQLAPAFSEWMMGLPAGWVTDVPGITRNEALRALGNGVVPQQAAAALREMCAWEAAA